jgi:hypothetical protein
MPDRRRVQRRNVDKIRGVTWCMAEDDDAYFRSFPYGERQYVLLPVKRTSHVENSYEDRAFYKFSHERQNQPKDGAVLFLRICFRGACNCIVNPSH